MAEVLIKIRKMALAQDMSIKPGKSLIMSGDLYPSDIAPVLAPNKYGNKAVFPMAWGVTHKSAPKPLVICNHLIFFSTIFVSNNLCDATFISISKHLLWISVKVSGDKFICKVCNFFSKSAFTYII